ncbi:MAG: hypothetical protein FJW96_01135 [Actinobacteria bacterium]|nr:hypothetical protein [Actinomycetota bacterium]
MESAHRFIGAAAVGVCVVAALVGGIVYWRRRGAGQITTHLLALGQTLLVAQVGIGLLLLADERRAAEQLHYLYGSLALGAALAPWFYAPAEGPKRLLWFAGLLLLAGVLATRAWMSGE